MHDVGYANKPSREPGQGLHSRTPAASAGPFAARTASPLFDDSPRMLAQRRLITAAFGPAVQRQETPEEQPLQGRFDGAAERATATPAAADPGRSGLPDTLRSGIESLSGLSMGHVRVHYNSAQPAQLNALAYAQGNDIHLAPGQERHLPHEAWHLVQQAKGRVRPTLQMKGGAPINDDPQLEQEADVMGARAAAGAAHDGTLPAAVGPGARQSRATPAGTGLVAQRRVGFEFEDTYWRPWRRETTFRATRPIKRKEVIHQGTGFRMEGDDTPGPAYSNVEFVTKPCDTTPQGLAELSTAMREIAVIEGRIGPLAGRNETQGNYVTRAEHQLSNNDAVLSRGRAAFNLKMQATQGVSLENTPTMFKYFGTNVPNETAAVGAMRQRARDLMPPPNPGDITDLIGSAPSFANTIAATLVHGGLPGNTDALLGFLTMVVLYVKGFSLSLAGGGLKYLAPFLGRTNFAVMFRMLPVAQRMFLANNNAQALVNAVIAGVNSQSVLQVAGINIDVNFAAGGPLVRNLLDTQRGTPGNRPAVFSSLTIEAWLQGITQGVDHLTPATITAWLQAHEPNLSKAERKRQRDTFLESFATVGDNRRGDVTDAPERLGQSRLVIMENRIIQPTGDPTFDNGKMTADQAHKAAYNYLRFFISLRNRAHLHQNPRYRDDDPP